VFTNSCLGKIEGKTTELTFHYLANSACSRWPDANLMNFLQFWCKWLGCLYFLNVVIHLLSLHSVLLHSIVVTCC